MEHASSAPIADASSVEDKVDHPHILWWVLIWGGLTVLALQGFNDAFYSTWVTKVHALPGQGVMAAIFYACIPIHLFEGVYAYRVAKRIGLERSALGWGVQCFLLGYPSTRLINIRKKAAN